MSVILFLRIVVLCPTDSAPQPMADTATEQVDGNEIIAEPLANQSSSLVSVNLVVVGLRVVI